MVSSLVVLWNVWEMFINRLETYSIGQRAVSKQFNVTLERSNALLFLIQWSNQKYEKQWVMTLYSIYVSHLRTTQSLPLVLDGDPGKEIGNKHQTITPSDMYPLCLVRIVWNWIAVLINSVSLWNLRHGSRLEEAHAMGQRHRKATQNSSMIRIFALRPDVQMQPAVAFIHRVRLGQNPLPLVASSINVTQSPAAYAGRRTVRATKPQK